MRKSQTKIQLSLMALALLLFVSITYALSSPEILNAYVEPAKVRPGNIMTVSADVSDSSGISSVLAKMPYENGTDTITLSLSSGTIYNGTWQGEWLVHDTAVKNYTSKIIAKNTLGKESYAFINWSDPSGWYSASWPYRRAITLSPATSMANYQVKVQLTAANFNYAQLSYPATGQDIRFTGSDGTTLQEYWIESWANGGTSTIWVNVSTSGTSTIYMYYGNSGASAVTSGANTFAFFDDFEYTDAITNHGWIEEHQGGPTAATSTDTAVTGSRSLKIVDSTVADDSYWRQSGYTNSNKDMLEFYVWKQESCDGGGISIHAKNSATSVGYISFSRYYIIEYGDGTDILNPHAAATWYKVGVILNNTNFRFDNAYVNDAPKDVSSLFSPSSLVVNNLGLSTGSNCVTAYIDALRVRKYASPEPGATVGSEVSHTVSLASVSNNAANPIKGGNTFTITPGGQADSISDNLYFYCRLDASGATSANTVCSQGNTAYSSPYSSMTCTATAPSDTASHTYYCRTFDDLIYSPEQTTGITTDSTPPTFSFVPQTDANNSHIQSSRNWAYINVSMAEQNKNTTILNWNGTNETLSCTGTAPNWVCGVNKTNLLIGTYTYYIWANDTVGNSNLTGTMTIYVQNITLTETLSPTIVNPSDSVTVSGQATLQPDGTGVGNNAMNVFLDGQLTPSTWWNTSWPYRKAITINGSTSALTDYQILVNLTSSNFNFSKANSQGNDTRFTWLNTTSNQEQNISFWIENWSASGSLGNATIWVKVPNVTASSVANTMLYMYYGNPSATYNNSLGGNSTFVTFDDFTTNYSIWTEYDPNGHITLDYTTNKRLGFASVNSNERPYVYTPINTMYNYTLYFSFYLNVGSQSSNYPNIGPGFADSIGSMDQVANGIFATLFDATSPTIAIRHMTGGSGSDSGSSISLSGTTTYYATFSRVGNTVTLKIFSDPTRTTQIAGSPITYTDVSIASFNYTYAFSSFLYGSGTGRDGWFDDISVRKYASPEPSVLSTGSQQTTTVTNSSGGYNYTLTAPATAGAHTVLVNLTNANGIYGENTTTFDVRSLVFDQFNLSDSAGRMNGILNPNQAYNITVRIQETNSTVNYTVSSGTFNVTVSGTNYPLAYTGSNSVWRTNTTALTAASSLGTYSFLANFTGTSGNGIRNVTQMNNNYSYFVKQLNITYAVSDSAIYASETTTINGTIYREPEHAASVGTPVQGAVNSGNLTGYFKPAGESQALWPYRKAITVNGSTSALTDYQILVNLTSSNFNFSKANSQGNDTRFTWLNTTSGQEQNVSFWIENWTASGSLGNATIWIKVPNVTASSVANTTLYMYYGNPAAAYDNSLGGKNTFDEYLDFESTLDGFSAGTRSTNYSLTGGYSVIPGINTGPSTRANAFTKPYIQEVSLYAPAGETGEIVDVAHGHDTNIGTDIDLGYPTSGKVGYYDSSWHASSVDVVTGAWATVRLVVKSDNSYSAYYNDALVFSGSPVMNVGNVLKLTKWLAGNSAYFDAVRIRKYASPEPSVLSVGAEQTNTTNSAGAYSFTYTPNASVTSITSVNFTLNATDSDGITNTTRSPQGAITVYPQIGVDGWASTTSACSNRVSDFNNSGAIFLCANVTYGSVAGLGGENVTFAVYKNGINNERSQNPVFNVTNTTMANFTPAGESQALWQYRKMLTINGSSSALSDYQLPINLTTAIYNNTGLVGSWHFTNNDTSDSSGYGNNGAQNGGVNCAATGKFGTGCGLNGTNDYINAGTGANVGSTFTVAAWVKLNAGDAGNAQIVVKGTDASTYPIYGLAMSSGKIVGYAGPGSNVDYLIQGTAAVSTGMWHYLTVTYNGTYGSTYVDGVYDTTDAAVGPGSNSNPLYFGVWRPGYNYGFNGTIDEVRIYNRSLSAAEIQEHYSAGKSRLDYQDLRFTWLNSTSNAEQNISYWLESDNQAWVKVPNVAASTVANTTVYMYYGNPSATSTSNGTNTFESFDGFEDGTTGGFVNSGENTFQVDTAFAKTGMYSLKVSGADISDYFYKDWGFNLNNATVEFDIYPSSTASDDIQPTVRNGFNAQTVNLNYPNSGYWGHATGGWTNTGIASTTGKWHSVRMDYFTGDKGNLYINSNLVYSATTITTNTGAARFSIISKAGSVAYWDNFRVRSYSSPEPSVLSVGSQETPSAIAYTSFTPNESSQYSLNVTAWNANINPSVTATASRAFEFGQLNVSSVNYDTTIYTTETAVVFGLIRDFMNSSWLNNATATNITISATSGTFNANWTLVNSTGGFNFTYTPPALSSTGSAAITINASYGNITGGWSGTISVTPAIGVDTWATNASCASRPSAISEVPTSLNDTGLVGYWKFDSVNASNYTSDSSGMGNNGQVLGGAALTPSGKFGAGMQFDGVDDYVDAGNGSSLNSSSFTISAWLNPSSFPTAYNRILSKDRYTSPFQGWQLVYKGAAPYGRVYFTSWDSAGTEFPGVIQQLIPNAWNFIVITYDGFKSTLYYNGGFVGSSNIFTMQTNASMPLIIGGGDGNNINTFFNGTIDDVRIWNRSLSADEISAHYNRTALSLCANVTYGQNKMAGAYVNFTVNRTGTSVYGSNPANVINNLYDAGTIVSTEITPDESTKYTVTAKAWNPDVSSAVASGTYGYTYGKVNTTIALSDNIIYDSGTSQVSGKVYDWMNESWTRNTPAWWNSSWPYRKALTINGSTSALTDYQANLTVLWDSGMNTTFADLRFTYLNSSGNSYDIMTKTLTRAGWKYFRNLGRDEEVLTLNQKTGAYEWQKPKEHISENYAGELYEIELETGNRILVTPSQRVYGATENKSVSVRSVMVPQVVKENSISFDLKSEDKTADMGSFEVAHISPQVLEMVDRDMIAVDDLLYLLPDSDCKRFVPGSKLVENGSQPVGHFEREAHFNPMSLSSSSRVILECGPFSSLLRSSTNSSFSGSSSTGCQSILSQNSSSSLVDNLRVLRYLSNMSLLSTSSRPASDQLTHGNASILCLKESSSGTVMPAIYISPLALNSSSFSSFFLKPSLNTSGQFMSGLSSNRSLSSLGIENVVLITAMDNTSYLCNCMNVCKCVKVFKSLETPENRGLIFNLEKVTDVYDKLIQTPGTAYYFLDESKNPVKVREIRKALYSGTVYDVDVENDVILVKRDGSDRGTWSGNQNAGTEVQIPYWIENYTAGVNATVWIKTNLSTGSNTIYMYYGNPSATSASNGANTFDFFDDFSVDFSRTLEGGFWLVNSTKWIEISKQDGSYFDAGVSGELRVMGQNNWNWHELRTKSAFPRPVIFEWSQRIPSQNFDAAIGYGFPSTVWTDINYLSGLYFFTNPIYRLLDGTGSSTFTGVPATSQTLKMALPPSAGFKMYVDGTLYETNTTYAQDNWNFVIIPQEGFGRILYMDNLRVRKYASPEPSVLSTDSVETFGGATVSLSATGGTILSNVSTNSTGGYSTTYTPPQVTSIQNYIISANSTDADGIYSGNVSTSLKVYPAPSKLNASIYTDRTYYNLGENVTIGVVMRNNESAIFTGALLRAKIYRNDTGTLVGTVDLPERAGYFAGSYTGAFNTTALPVGWYYINITSEADSYSAPLSGSGKLFYANPFKLDIGLVSPSCAPSGQATQGETQRYDLEARNYTTGLIITPLAVSSYWNTSSGLQFAEKLDTYDGIPCSLSVDIIPSNIQEIPGGISLTLANATSGGSDASRMLEYVMKYPFWDDNMTDTKFLEKRVPVEIDNRLSPQIQNAYVEINGSELEAAGVQLSSMSLDSIRVIDPRKVPEWPDELWGSEVPYNITDYGSDGYVNQSDKIRFLVNLSENSREYVYIYYTNLSSGFSYMGTSLSGTPYAPYSVKPLEEAPVLITSMRLDKQIYTRYPTVTVNYSVYTPNPSPYPPTVTNTFLQCRIYSPSGSLEVDTGVTQIYNNTYLGSKEMSTTSGLFGEYTLICTATDQAAGKANIYSQKFLEEEIGTTVYLYPASLTSTGQTFSISGNTSIASSGAALPDVYVNMSTLACESTFWRGLFGLGPYCEAYQNSTVSSGAGEYSATLTLTIPSDYFDLHVGSNHTHSYANGTFLASGYIYGSNTTQYSVKYAAATNLWLLADNSPYSPVTLNLQMNTTSTTQQGVNVTYEILNKTSGLSYVNLSSDIVVLNSSGGGVNYFTKNWSVDYLPAGEYTVVVRLMQGDWVSGTDSATFYRMNLTHAVNTTDTYTNEPIYLDGTLYWPNGTAADENLKVQYTGADVGRLTQNYFVASAAGGIYGMATPIRIPDNNYTLRVASARVMGDDAAKGLSEQAGIKVRLRVLSMLGSDAAQYKANTAVNLTLRANSTANWTVGPTAAFNVTDRDTFVQAQYNSTWNASLPGMTAYENRTRSYLWNTTNNPPGNYTIASGIIDAYGQLAGSANTTVELIATKTAAISSSLDKSAYSMYEIVNISGTINRTGNVEFSGNLTVYVVNQNTGTVCSYCSCGQAYVVISNDSKTTPVAFSYGWNTSSYLAGNYLAVSNFTWLDEDGISRSIVSQKTFTIDIVRLASVSVTTSNTTYALTSPTFNITAAVVNKGNWFTGAGAGGGNLTVKATDMAGNDDTPTTQGGVYLNAPWYKNPIPTACNYNSSNYNYTWSTWLYNNKPLNYMPNGLLYVFDKMRDSGNYTIRANYTFEGGSAFSEEKNITVLQSAALTQPPTFYISKKGEPYEGDATNPILAYANEGRWFGLIVTNAGNVEMQNLTANFTVGCSSPPLTLGPYPVKTTLGVGSTNTYMLYENASIPWNTRQTPVNGDQNPCVVNALLYTPAIYDGCPLISGGVCVWFDSMAYEPSQAKALNIKKTEAMQFNLTINNNTFTSTNADAVVGGTINNTGNVWLNGTISGKIYSLSGTEIATMSCTPSGIIYLAPSPAQAVNCTWNTGLTEAVNYTANITYNWGTGSNTTGIPFSISAIKRAAVYVFANSSAHNQSADVSITGNVSNIGNYNVTGNLTLRFMQGESIIETINTTNNITIGVAGAFNFTFALNTKGYPYGLYNVTATYTYLNENGNATNATGNYLLTINENRSITLSMDTDRASYKSNWGVNITVDLNNTGNAVLSGASLIYTVKQGATPVATYTDNLGDSTVSIGEAYKRSWLWNTGTYAAGTYTVEAKVSDSTLSSWARIKDIQVNATRTASIAGLSVDVMPPSNYELGNTIYVYGIVNATGNVPFSGNLSLRYYNNQLVADTYDNRTGVATGFSMSPSVTGSATAIDVGVINLTATYLWIDEDGQARSASSSATFFIGGTSVAVTFGATNTYNYGDAVPLLVHVAGMGGNITGLTAGNFTITDGVNTYTPPMAEQGSGNYLFTFAKNAFDIGDYAISVTVIDPATSVPGTGTANLYIRDHWITVRVDANSALASSEADAGQGYAAAKSGQALVALVQRGGALDSLSATANSLVMKQKLTANRFNLVMTQGSVKENIRDRIKLIASGEFEKYASPSFGFALAKDYHVSVSRIYDAIDLIGVNVGTFRPGMYNLIIKNDGASNGKTKIVVSRK